MISEDICGEEAITQAKWSRRAAVANAGGAMLTLFAVVLMWYTKLRIFLFSIYLIPLFLTVEAEIFYVAVLIGGLLAVPGAVLSLRRKFYAGAIGVTLFSFILGGSFLSLLALVFLAAAKKEFGQEVERET